MARRYKSKKDPKIQKNTQLPQKANVSAHTTDFTLTKEQEVSELEAAQALSLETGLSFVDLSECLIDESLKDLIPAGILRRDLMLPLSRNPYEENTIRLAVADPYDETLVNDFVNITGMQPELCIAAKKDILSKIFDIYGPAVGLSLADVFLDYAAQKAADLDPLHHLLPPYQADMLQEALVLGTGILIVSGTTYSRVSEVLHAAVNSMDCHAQSVFSVEEKVSSYLPWVTQIQADGKNGLTPAVGLSVALSSRPDAVMIGRLTGFDMAEQLVAACASGCFILAGLVSEYTMTPNHVSVILNRMNINHNTVSKITVITL